MTTIPRTCPIMPPPVGYFNVGYFNNAPRPCRRPVISPEGVRYESVTQAAAELRRPITTVHGWLRRAAATGWRYADTNIDSPTPCAG